MKYYKGTQNECDAYNELVTHGEGYNDITLRWSDSKEIKGNFYILKHPDYPAIEGLIESELPELHETEEDV